MTASYQFHALKKKKDLKEQWDNWFNKLWTIIIN